MQLTVRNLSKTYPNGTRALNGVDLDIGTGMFGLLGQNGAGKSSLMRTIATLQDPDTGSITFGDIDVMKQPARLRKVLGYLPQDFGVYPNLSGRELLIHLADLKGIGGGKERAKLADFLLERVNLVDAGRRKLGGYSGGMRQRFGIAQALLGDPKLIIVDEPTAGLDPMERNRFYNLLAEIGENTVVILSTHIVEDVSTLCQNLAVISRGEVVLAGAPADLTRALDGRLWEAAVGKEELPALERNTHLISRRYQLGDQLVTVVADTQPSPAFRSKKAGLEDVYFNITATAGQSVTA